MLKSCKTYNNNIGTNMHCAGWKFIASTKTIIPDAGNPNTNSQTQFLNEQILNVSKISTIAILKCADAPQILLTFKFTIPANKSNE